MNTGEDTGGLRKIIDFTRLLSLFILAIHFYVVCYGAFVGWGWTVGVTDRIIENVARTGLFEGLWRAKLGALLLLVVSLVGVKGKKDEQVSFKRALWLMGLGVLVYFGSILFLCWGGVLDGGEKSFWGLGSHDGINKEGRSAKEVNVGFGSGEGFPSGSQSQRSFSNTSVNSPNSFSMIAMAYMGLTCLGYMLVLTGGGLLSRLIKEKLNKDIFNEENETFPQEERLIENEYSINLPAVYRLGKTLRKSWINFINPFRGLLVAGTPGAGKSYFVIRHIIDQHIRKGFSMFIYDFKFDDLSKIAYNKLLKYASGYEVRPKFYVINFDDLNRSHRCNPLDPLAMEDITDATEASRTIMMGLNRDWIKKQGDFFVESPINFLTACIWYLRKYEDGRFCTLPHVIELMQSDYEPLFAVLKTQEEIKVLINPFISAYQNNAMAQLEGQIASAKIGLARLSSPQLYYVLSGNDFSLDVNNPSEPKIICVGNNPQKLQVYGAVLSLYISRMIKLVNRKGQLKSSLIFDEFPTIYFNNMDSLIATARSNQVATCLAVQDFSQLKKDYGAEQADVITGIVGNVISGQVTGSTAKTLSENFGKISQQKDSMSINSSDTSITKATQMDYAIPASKIATLSSGEFVGVVADNPGQKIRLKMFHSEIQNDHGAIAREEARYKEIPMVKKVSAEDVEENYKQVKRDIFELLKEECEKLAVKPEFKEEVKKKSRGKKDAGEEHTVSF